MAMPNKKEMISTEEARIMLLEQRNDDFAKTLVRIENRLEHMESIMDSKFDKVYSEIKDVRNELKQEIKWQFVWIMGVFITVSGGMIAAMAHGFKWF